MSKAVTGTSMAAIAALLGTYKATTAFIPATPGSMTDVGGPSLRGAASAGDANLGQSTSQGAPSAALPVGVAAAGALAMAAVGRSGAGRRSRAARRAEAAAAPTGEEEPPPPPPFNPADQMGVTDPIGFFDPAGFSKVGDEEGFRKLRIAEMKHGRVAMMAAVGAVIQHYLQFPGFDAVPKGIWAPTSGNGTIGFAALFLVSGALELTVWKDDSSKPVASIGDYGNPLQLGIGQPLGESADMRNRELNNGRAAMFAALGIIAAELVSGKDAMQQFGFS
mmetsp:Transcript_107605/g.240001  ORF Transcript_107605/g.240001 Transcript_107605/m.240001 type:complete len:278 (-) Transcript_107605:55-888(-)